MYKLIITLKNIYQALYIFKDEYFYTILIEGEKFIFSKLNYLGDVLWQLQEEDISDFFEPLPGEFIVSAYSKTESYFLKNETIKPLERKTIVFKEIDNEIFTAYEIAPSGNRYCIIYKSNLKVKQSIPSGKGGFNYSHSYQIIFHFSDGLLEVFDKLNELLWAIDFSKTHSTKDVIFGARSGQVAAVISYKEFLIVLVGTKMMKFLILTGELQSEVEIGHTIASRVEIFEDKLYNFGSGGYRIFNPENFYLEKNIKFKEQFYGGEELGLQATGFTFNKGLLWYCSHRYGNYVAGIEPLTGEQKELLIIPNSTAALDSLHFYNGKVFIRDSDCNLFIFEKGAEI